MGSANSQRWALRQGLVKRGPNRPLRVYPHLRHSLKDPASIMCSTPTPNLMIPLFAIGLV
jgi:hypothetical protein